MLKLFTTFLLITLLSACSNGNNQGAQPGPSNPFAGFTSTLYSNSDNWMCHPSLAVADNICAGDLDATLVFADGSQEVKEHTAATAPEVDCFYVYPTVSSDSGGNSDLEAGELELSTTFGQVALYSRFCRIFAPVYRQYTISSIFSDAVEGDLELAYGDVVDSFKQYMASENNGRGFILVGHSQGSRHLLRLIAETIEMDEYLLEHMIAAHLLGWSIYTPEGADVGADFQQVAVCRTADQTGCVVNYSSYRNSDPFLAAGDARYGNPRDGASAICTHPAALSGGSANLDAYFSIERFPLMDPRADGPYANPDQAPPINTPWYKMPGFLSGECRVDPNGISYLEVTAHADPTDPRADDFNGEFLGNNWGLHLTDLNIAQGDLVNLGSSQARAWLEDQ
jgi:hypothetical protein